jgi:competence protein ComEC
VRYPAVPLAAALVAGAALGVADDAQPGAVAAALALGYSLCVLSWREAVAPAMAAAAIFTAAASGYALASTAARAATHTQLRAALRVAGGPGAVSDAPGPPVTLVGTLLADASPGGSGIGLALRVRQAALEGPAFEADGGVLLTVAGEGAPDRAEQWRRGRTVALSAHLRRPSRYLNPGARNDEDALALRGVTLVGTVKSALLVRVTARGHPLAEWAAALRLRVRHVIDRLVGCHSVRSAAIVRAILLGDRAGLDDETEERLRQAGTYHVIAISGGNIAVLALVLMAVATLAGLRPGLTHLAAAALLVAYAFIVGSGASVVRATQMAVLYLVARAADHRAKPYNAIAVSAGLTCAADPLAVRDAGAWLTYGATIAILAGTPLLVARMGLTGRWVRLPGGLFGASLAAELALFPVSAYVFSQITAAGLVLNFVAIPLMSVVQVGGMLLVALDCVTPAGAAAVAWLTHAAAWGLVESARLVDVTPWAVLRVPAPGAPALLAYYGAWAAWFAAGALGGAAGPQGRVRRVSRRAAAAILVASGAWIVWTPGLRAGRPAQLEATVIDVGQGAAALVRFPSGDAILVDAGGAGGGRFDIGRRVVEPAVWAAGAHRISHLVATHGDGDHIGGAAAVTRDLRPREIWEGVPVPPDPLVRELAAAAGLAGASWRTVQRGDRVRFGEADVLVWNPAPPAWERQRVRNDDSIVLEVRFGRVALLLAGDAEAAAEAEVARLLEPAGVRVLLAAHHGSATSSTWPLLRAATPALVVVSAGRGNRYGHPHPAVLERYRAIGAAVLRTDLDGAVRIRTDGTVVEARTFTGRRVVLAPRQAAPPAPPA